MSRAIQPLRVVLSGPGLIGRKHASLLEENADTSLVAIVAPDNENNNNFAVQNGVQRFGSLHQALNETPTDAVIISSPNTAHFEQAALCIYAGIPALVEKPLTATLASAARLVDLAEAKGTHVLVGHHRTYSPLLDVARDFLASDAFGMAVAVQGAALFCKPEGYFVSGPWRTCMGGGPILINMIHEIGILRYLFGEIESVTAQLSSATRGFEVEDSAAITFSFVNGALGTFLLSDTSASNKSWEMTAGENPAYPFFSEQDCYHFAGTMGSLDFPSMRCRTYSRLPDRSWWTNFRDGRLDVERQDPLKAQLDHFVEVVQGRAVPRVSARDGYLNMVVLDAILEAARTGQQIRVGDVAA